VAVSCKHGNEPSGSVTGRKFLNYLTIQLPSKDGLFTMEFVSLLNMRVYTLHKSTGMLRNETTVAVIMAAMAVVEIMMSNFVSQCSISYVTTYSTKILQYLKHVNNQLVQLPPTQIHLKFFSTLLCTFYFKMKYPDF
jgi:hypothetical protein